MILYINNSLLDKKNCTVINYCDIYNNGGCNQICYNKPDGHECRCKEKYYLDTDNETCIPYQCREIQMNSCPPNSYTDDFGSVCEMVNVSCTNRAAINGRCTFQCIGNYGMALISQPDDKIFGDNFIMANVSEEANCIYDDNDVDAKWNIDETLLQKYFCRRLNDPPNNLTLSNSSILEYSALYHDIGVLSVTDDEKQSVVFTVMNSEGVDSFQIRNGILQNTQVFKLKNMQYKDTIDVMIRAEDNGNPRMFIQKLFTVKVLNVNEPPNDIKISNNNLTDVKKVGSVIGVLSAIDPDHSLDQRLSSELNWTLIDPYGHFKINGSNLMLIKELNRTNEFLYTVTVTCTDHDVPPSSTTKDIIIQYKISNLFPVDFTVNMVKLFENITVASTVGKIVAVENKNHQVSFFDLSSEEFKLTFTVNPTNCSSNAHSINGKHCFADIGKFFIFNYHSFDVHFS